MKTRFQRSRRMMSVGALALTTLFVAASAPLNAAAARSAQAAFAQIDLYPNIETVGVVVSGANLPARADLYYRQANEAIWHRAHPLMRVDDGRLVGSLFGLSASTAYNIKVSDGTSEISGAATTQPVDLPFTPSAIVYVDQAAAPGGDGSSGAPFKTIQDGVDHAAPGTQVLVADGVYHESVSISNSGAPGSWIQIKAQGSGAILDGSSLVSGNVWKPDESRAHIWFTKITNPIGYLARDGQRFYLYDDMAGLTGALGHNGIPMNEGWFFEPTTLKLYVRSLDDPSTHRWQVPYLNHAFDVDTHDWIWIEGFEMRFYGTQYGCGVCTTNASHIVIRSNKIHNLQNGIFINWTGGDDRGNDTRIEYNDVSDPPLNQWPWKAVKATTMEGTDVVIRGRTGAIVRNNDLHESFNGIYIGSSAALENSQLAFDVDIYNNHIHDIADDALEPEGACINCRFRNNLAENTFVGMSLAPVTQGPAWVLRNVFANFSGRGFKWDRSSDGIILIYHNTTWTNAPDADAMEMISPVSNATLRNNIFQTRFYNVYEVATGSSGHDWDYDNFYTSRASQRFEWENRVYDALSNFCASTNFECHGNDSPPGLANPGGGDFTLSSASAQIDRGLAIPGINDNFSGGAPDLGAFESASGAPVTRVLSIARTDADLTGAATVNFSVTFSAAVSGVDAGDFVLNASSLSGAVIASVSQTSPANYNVAVSTGSGSGTLRLDLVDNDSIIDASSIPLGGAGAGNGNFNSGDVYHINKQNPSVLNITRASASPSSSDSVQFIVNFSEAVSGVSADDFTPFATGIVGASVSVISGSGASYTVTVNAGTGDGSLRLDLNDNDSIVNATGNPLGGVGAGNGNFTGGESYALDRTPPSVTSSLRLDPDPTRADLVNFAVTFSESVSGVDVRDFALTIGGSVTDASILGVSGSGNAYFVAVNTGHGNGTIRLDVIDDDSITDTVAHPLGGIGAGNGNFTSGNFYTSNKPMITMQTATFRSNGNNDGRITESSKGSGRGGVKNSDAATFRVGDDDGDRQYRSILDFQTSSLPDNAVVTQVLLVIKRQMIVGTDPFTTHQNIVIDVRKGAFGNFGPFGIRALQVTDFQAGADLNGGGTIYNNPVGDLYWSLLNAAANSLINTTGATQLRLRFQLPNNNDMSADYIAFASGDASALGDRPELEVQYYVPK